MVTSRQCFKKYGDPNLLETQRKHFEVWQVPQNIRQAFAHVFFTQVGTIGFPKRIFINKDFKPIFEKALLNLIERGFAHEMKTYDGVFNIRFKRGGKTLSIHSWANACDLNREENQMGMKPKLSKGFVKCFTDAGCDWGGNWSRPDGMHFQISKI